LKVCIGAEVGRDATPEQARVAAAQALGTQEHATPSAQRRRSVMNASQARILEILRQWVKDWRAIIDAIERKSVRYYEDRGNGRVETTQETLIDYQKRVTETEALIEKLTPSDS
jgi:hypothetical protein